MKGEKILNSRPTVDFPRRNMFHEKKWISQIYNFSDPRPPQYIIFEKRDPITGNANCSNWYEAKLKLTDGNSHLFLGYELKFIDFLFLWA
jgi:hypothetical protein